MSANAWSLPRATRFVAVVASLALVACDSVPRPTEPDNAGVEAAAGGLASSHTSAYSSGSAGITTYDGIFPATADPYWTTTQCGPTPTVGPGAAWQNPHAPFVVGSGYPLNSDPGNFYVHPWLNNVGAGGASFTAPWINSWNNPSSTGPTGTNATGQSWTKYTLSVSGTGQHVVQLLADNCSWIYLDGSIVGVQGVTSAPAVYPVTLAGTHDLTFIIFDGGGAAGGKFRLETRQSFIDHGGNPALLPPPIQTDATPPTVTANVTGALGNNGWYTSNINVSWNVNDSESAITSAPCAATDVTTDTNGATASCSATSAGGTTDESVTVKRDATVPAISFSGNAGTYTVDQTVAITCSATDAMSGIASSTCPGATGPAYTFGVGAETLSASAEDNAGLTAAASTSFTVQVTSGSLCALVNQWVSQKGVANSMCQQLKNGAYGAFRNHVSAQSDKTVTSAHAAILIALSQSL